MKIKYLEKYIKEKLNGELPDYKEIGGLMKKLEKEEDEKGVGILEEREKEKEK